LAVFDGDFLDGGFGGVLDCNLLDSHDDDDGKDEVGWRTGVERDSP